jgi:hypothetical protein
MAQGKDVKKSNRRPTTGQHPSPSSGHATPVAARLPTTIQQPQGILTEYMRQRLDSQHLQQERESQLRRISQLRGGRDVLVYAANLASRHELVPVGYADLVPLADFISTMKAGAIDLVLETPGGSGEVAEDIVRLLRKRYDDVAVIVPGCAKSAGTLIAMGANELIMGPMSSLGPIDAQLSSAGKPPYSAHAFLEGLEKIKEEVDASGNLNKAYIPILQQISPGDIQHARNAQDFAKTLVTQWLNDYKFKNWTTHRSTGEPVTDADRLARADKIASELCNHGRWLTHGRSLKIEDLEDLELQVTDYSKDPELADAITRYQSLAWLTFRTPTAPGEVCKIIETHSSHFYVNDASRGKIANLPPSLPAQLAQQAKTADLDFECSICHVHSMLQANLGAHSPLKAGSLAFPKDDQFKCPNCGSVSDLAPQRAQIEGMTGKKVV